MPQYTSFYMRCRQDTAPKRLCEKDRLNKGFGYCHSKTGKFLVIFWIFKLFLYF